MTMPESRPNGGFDLKIFATTAVKNKISQVMEDVPIPAAQSQSYERFEREAREKNAAFRRQAAHIVRTLDAIIKARDFHLFDKAYLETKNNSEQGHSFYKRAMIGNRDSLDKMLEESWREQRPDHERAASIHHRDGEMLVIQKDATHSERFLSKLGTMMSRLRWGKNK